MEDNRYKSAWLTSKETQKLLGISGCELMHLRANGKLTFKKKGNAFYYQINMSEASNNEIR